MSETAIVSRAPGDLHDGVRMSTTPEEVLSERLRIELRPVPPVVRAGGRP